MKTENINTHRVHMLMARNVANYKFEKRTIDSLSRIKSRTKDSQNSLMSNTEAISFFESRIFMKSGKGTRNQGGLKLLGNQ